jgi:hypothetical protein
MEFRRILKALGSKLQGLFQARGIKTRLFSGTPVVSRINPISGDIPGFSLVYRNGLMLTLGEAGILDYQDRGFGSFIGGPGLSVAPDNREFLVQLHKLVLKSLLRYITHPGLDTIQREFAAEAATKLWLAEMPGSAETHDRPGYMASAPLHSFRNTAGKHGDGSWSMGSSRESAPFR